MPTRRQLAGAWKTNWPTVLGSNLLRLLPYENFDEWYVFTSPTRLCSRVAFSSTSGGSRLELQEEPLAELDPTWDRVGAKALADEQMLQQCQFWSQLELFGAESNIADGDNFIFATANTGLFARVEIAFRSV